jgi:hypothetical protein
MAEVTRKNNSKHTPVNVIIHSAIYRKFVVSRPSEKWQMTAKILSFADHNRVVDTYSGGDDSSTLSIRYLLVTFNNWKDLFFSDRTWKYL